MAFPCIKTQARGYPQRAFTLLEIMIATAIIGVAMLAMYSFLSTHLEAMSITTETARRERELAGFQNLVDGWARSWRQPTRVNLVGLPHKFDELPSDEFSFTSRAGDGLLSAAGEVDYRVTMLLRRVEGKVFDLGLIRVPDGEVFQTAKDWAPLVRNLRGLEIRYFDPQQHTWVDTWNGRGDLPRMIRIRLWVAERDNSQDFVICIPPRGQPL
jgi:prepilin-type N-terminal cleavage/methylation domain-containing protein